MTRNTIKNEAPDSRATAMGLECVAVKTQLSRGYPLLRLLQFVSSDYSIRCRSQQTFVYHPIMVLTSLSV